MFTGQGNPQSRGTSPSPSGGARATQFAALHQQQEAQQQGLASQLSSVLTAKQINVVDQVLEEMRQRMFAGRPGGAMGGPSGSSPQTGSTSQ